MRLCLLIGSAMPRVTRAESGPVDGDNHNGDRFGGQYFRRDGGDTGPPWVVGNIVSVAVNDSEEMADKKN